MADKRAYFHVDVGYFQNPKVAPLVETNPRAVILHLQAIAYSAQHLTDGLAPKRLVMNLAGVEPCSKQCGEQCIEQCDLQCTIENGLLYVADERTIGVHDYLEHQRSSADAKKASDKGKRAADARWSDASSNAPSIASSNAKRERKNSLVADATRPDVDGLCSLLADLIEGNGSKKPTITKAWRDSARLMLDRDGRDATQAEWLIRWSQKDEFWRTNILSMPKFREKYDQLRIKSGQGVRVNQTFRVVGGTEWE